MHIKHAISGILIKAALSAKTPSEKKERLIHLYNIELIDVDQLNHIVNTEGLNEICL